MATRTLIAKELRGAGPYGASPVWRAPPHSPRVQAWGTAHATGTVGGVRTYVLVHGTHSAGAFWTAIGRELALRGHRVVVVDQPFLISEQE